MTLIVVPELFCPKWNINSKPEEKEAERMAKIINKEDHPSTSDDGCSR